MDKSYESKYHQLEESNWWFVARRDIIYRLIKSFNPKDNIDILDVGCSGGNLIEFLKNKGFHNLSGIDISADAIKICQQKDLSNVFVADGIKTPFPENKFDIIIASDILEHIKDDGVALKEWKRILKKDGKMIIFVPAFGFLWSDHDKANQHYRRYTKNSLSELAKKSGCRTERISYWNFLLFLPTFIVRIVQRLFTTKSKNSDQLYSLNSLINKMLIILVKLENYLLAKKINLPWGVSVFAIIKK